MSQVLVGSNVFGSARVYRLVGPAITVDASGGVIQVNANTKFNTNLPLDRYMLITQIKYFITWTKMPASPAVGGANIGSWNIFAQLTEALARTVPTTTDPVFVDEWTLFVKPGQESTAVGAIQHQIAFPGSIDRILYNPWSTAAQQLNQIVSLQPNNNEGTGGPSVSVAPVLEYQLLPLTADILSYLATRVQIG